METSDKKSNLFWVGLMVLLSTCGVKDIGSTLNTTQASRLLTSDDHKTWTLISRLEAGEDNYNVCLEDNTLTFVQSDEYDSLYFMGRSTPCLITAEIGILHESRYTLSQNTRDEFLNQLDLTDEKILGLETIRIEQLTASHLSISYYANELLVEEQYKY